MEILVWRNLCLFFDMKQNIQKLYLFFILLWISFALSFANLDNNRIRKHILKNFFSIQIIFINKEILSILDNISFQTHFKDEKEVNS